MKKITLQETVFKKFVSNIVNRILNEALISTNFRQPFIDWIESIRNDGTFDIEKAKKSKYYSEAYESCLHDTALKNTLTFTITKYIKGSTAYKNKPRGKVFNGNIVYALINDVITDFFTNRPIPSIKGENENTGKTGGLDLFLSQHKNTSTEKLPNAFVSFMQWYGANIILTTGHNALNYAISANRVDDEGNEYSLFDKLKSTEEPKPSNNNINIPFDAIQNGFYHTFEKMSKYNEYLTDYILTNFDTFFSRQKMQEIWDEMDRRRSEKNAKGQSKLSSSVQYDNFAGSILTQIWYSIITKIVQDYNALVDNLNAKSEAEDIDSFFSKLSRTEKDIYKLFIKTNKTPNKITFDQVYKNTRVGNYYSKLRELIHNINTELYESKKNLLQEKDLKQIISEAILNILTEARVDLKTALIQTLDWAKDNPDNIDDFSSINKTLFNTLYSSVTENPSVMYSIYQNTTAKVDSTCLRGGKKCMNRSHIKDNLNLILNNFFTNQQRPKKFKDVGDRKEALNQFMYKYKDDYNPNYITSQFIIFISNYISYTLMFSYTPLDSATSINRTDSEGNEYNLLDQLLTKYNHSENDEQQDKDLTEIFVDNYRDAIFVLGKSYKEYQFGYKASKYIIEHFDDFFDADLFKWIDNEIKARNLNDSREVTRLSTNTTRYITNKILRKIVTLFNETLDKQENGQALTDDDMFLKSLFQKGTRKQNATDFEGVAKTYKERLNKLASNKFDKLFNQPKNVVSINETVIKNIISDTLNRILNERKKAKKSVYPLLGKEKYTKLRNTDNGSKTRQIKMILTDKKINRAQIAYKLWPDLTKDAARSLFSKKLFGRMGQSFTDDEVAEVWSILNNKIK